MRQGVYFDARLSHERAHLEPLRQRLRHVRAGQAAVADVVVMADTRKPVPEAWNVQLFHGLGDKGYTGNPIFLQKGRWPRLRTAGNRLFGLFGMSGPFLRPPEDPGRRSCRYQQVNAYGPRLHDALEDMLQQCHITGHGHVALNDRANIRFDPEGPVLWLPTWDNRKFLGGVNQSSLDTFAHEVALVSRHVPVRVKYHPLSLRHRQSERARQEMEREPGVAVVPADANPYDLLGGIRAVLTDTSSIGFEAYCMGIPVGIATPVGVAHRGLHAELAERAHVLHSGRPDLLGWAEDPDRPTDRAWAREILYPPEPRRNDAFAAELESRVGA